MVLLTDYHTASLRPDVEWEDNYSPIISPTVSNLFDNLNLNTDDIKLKESFTTMEMGMISLSFTTTAFERGRAMISLKMSSRRAKFLVIRTKDPTSKPELQQL
ncbi:hypothetical protein AX15_002898 [Amanita polypyramis BW_CC]|nr:hypothetical protein AX15_002898 [Amanita polypyramis BW_CC]